MITGENNSNSKLHILIMPSWYKTPETPVLGTFFEEQARALEKENYKVGIIYPEYTPPGELFTQNKEYLDFYMDKGMPTFNIKTPAGIPKLRRLSYTQFGKSVNHVFQQYVEHFGMPDIIHAHSVFHAGIAAYYISKANKIPLVITEHLTAYLMGYITNKVDIEIAREIFRYADSAIIVSHNFRKDLEKQLDLEPHTFTVVHNLVNDLFLQSFSAKGYTPGETFRFFTNSFLLPRKNITLIIDAIKILKDKNLKVHLTIGGDGPQEDTLKEYVNTLSLEKEVTFTGKLYRDEVKNELDNCHAFVLSSQYETFGVVLIESLACGRPVICTQSGGPLDFIRPEHGIIVDEHKPEPFAAAMEKVIIGYDSYDQKSLSEYCRQNFNEHKIASEMMNLYHKVLAKKVTYSA
jgi:L-malate glycosyltransferase